MKIEKTTTEDWINILIGISGCFAVLSLFNMLKISISKEKYIYFAIGFFLLILTLKYVRRAKKETKVDVQQ